MADTTGSDKFSFKSPIIVLCYCSLIADIATNKDEGIADEVATGFVRYAVCSIPSFLYLLKI